MPEILLAVVVVALLVERVVAQRDHTRQVARLLNRIEARTPSDLVILNRAEDGPTTPADVHATRELIHPIGA